VIGCLRVYRKYLRTSKQYQIPAEHYLGQLGAWINMIDALEASLQLFPYQLPVGDQPSGITGTPEHNEHVAIRQHRGGGKRCIEACILVYYAILYFSKHASPKDGRALPTQRLL